MKIITALAAAVATASLGLLGAHTSAGRSPPAPGSKPVIPYTGPAPLIGSGLRGFNWSGYAVHGGTYHSVSASWTEPYAHATGTRHMSSFWVGLDGWGDNTVEQIGTEANIVNGRAVYYAWYEFCPAYQVEIKVPVAPGDHLSASAKVTGGTHYTLKLTDYTQGWTSTARSTRYGLANESAEVIAEATSYRGVIQSLTNFGTVRFTNAKVDGSAIGDHHPTKIIMVDHHGRLKDKISSLSGGKNWHAAWMRK